MKYRAEIDGFRAIAVLSVLIFHFYPVTTSVGFNGFLGVDIFFVISGFLISQYIFNNLETNSFSFKVFYYRRIKRILPAALVVLAAMTALSIFILTPADHKKFSYSAISSLLFVPNIYFWRTGGYFGELDTLKPLLNFWSLGIEEQFYLLFPLILFITSKLFNKRNFIFLIILLITLLSFMVNIFLLSIGGDNPAFFLLPARMWEFGLGALAAFANLYYINWRSRYLSDVLFLCLVFGLFFSGSSYIPQALFVVIFTAIFLSVTHNSNTYSYKLLSSSFLRFFGKISFSLYLWHWPVIVFIGYTYIEDIPTQYTILGIILTVILSFFSFRYIEEPFRHQYSDKKLFSLLLVTSVFIISVSFVGVKKDISLFNSTLVKNIANEVQTNWRCPAKNYEFFGGSRACHLKGIKDIEKADTLLIGNSHAQMYAPLIINNHNFENVYLIPLNSCTPTINVNISTFCLKAAKKNVLAINELKHVKKIIIGTTFYRDFYINNSSKATKKDYAKDLINLIESFNEKGIITYLIGPIPTPQFNFASKASRGLKFSHLTISDYKDFSSIEREQFIESIDIFDKLLTENLGNHYLRAHEYFCDINHCYFGDKGGAFFSDTNHLGKYGLERINPLFENIQ